MAVEERGFAKISRRAGGTGRNNNGWLAPAMARDPSTTRTIIIVVVVVAVAVLLTLVGWVVHTKWKYGKQKRKTPLAATAETAVETRDADHDNNPRPSVLASSKSRKQAAAPSWEP